MGKPIQEWTHGTLLCQIYPSVAGHRVGYVGVPRNHPLFGKQLEVIRHMQLSCNGWSHEDGWHWFGFDTAQVKGDVESNVKRLATYLEQRGMPCKCSPGTRCQVWCLKEE